MGQGLFAAVIAVVISFAVGEVVVWLLARHNRAARRRYLPAVITFVLLMAIYAYVVNFGAAG